MKSNKLLRYFGKNLEGNRKTTVLAAVYATLEVVLEILIPLLMSVIVDGGLYRKENFMLRSLFPEWLIADRNRFVITVGAIMVFIAILSMAAGILSAYYASYSSQGFAKNLRASMLEKIQSFSFANTDKFTIPSLITRATTDINSVRNTMFMFIRTLFRQPIMLILSIVMAMAIAPNLALIFLIAVPLLALVIVILLKVGYPRFKAMLEKTDDMNRAVQENLTSNRVVKAYVRGDYESDRFEDTAGNLKTALLRSGRLFNLTGPVQMAIMWTVSVIILYVGGSEIIFEKTGLLTGQLVSIISYTTRALSALSMMSWLIMAFSRAQASLNRINEVLDEEPDITDGPSDAKVEDGSVTFENVSFSYSGNMDKLAVNHVSFSIKSGETVGVIGGTGEGKSSLVSLIPRFYDASEGRILVGGRDVREYTLDNLRESVSMVLQNGTLFSGTIADNLRWGKKDATEEEMDEACYISCAHEFVNTYPEKYEKVLEQGAANLSGGQKQRLRIARAVIKKPKILILDDSTSAVDMTTDEHIRKALRNTLPDSTKIIIAQRIASIVTCDRIIVLDEGKLSDFGTHAELMERSRIYRDVYDSQMREEAND